MLHHNQSDTITVFFIQSDLRGLADILVEFNLTLYILNNTFLDYIPGNAFCLRDPVHLLVLQDVFGVDEIQDSQQKCCNQCQSDRCKINCEIIGMLLL